MINTKLPNKLTKIYLVTNCYGDPNKVYIGKTVKCRKNRHKETYGKDITYDYIDEINSVLKEDWEPLETFWIQYFHFLGFDVQNKKLKGGGGSSFLSEETRNKISKSNKGKIVSNITRQKMKKPRPGSGKSNELYLFNINRPIIQYDLGGNFIKDWDNIKIAADSLEIKYKNQIIKCCNGIYNSCNGFVFKFKDNPLDINFKYIKHSSREINQYDSHNNFIKKWDSVFEIMDKFNIKDRSAISKCCAGNMNSAYGYKWKYNL